MKRIKIINFSSKKQIHYYIGPKLKTVWIERNNAKYDLILNYASKEKILMS